MLNNPLSAVLDSLVNIRNCLSYLEAISLVQNLKTHPTVVKN